MKFRKVPKLFRDRKVRTVRTDNYDCNVSISLYVVWCQLYTGNVIMVCGQTIPPVMTSAGRTVLVNLVIAAGTQPPPAATGLSGYGFTLSYKTACKSTISQLILGHCPWMTFNGHFSLNSFLAHHPMHWRVFVALWQICSETFTATYNIVSIMLLTKKKIKLKLRAA